MDADELKRRTKQFGLRAIRVVDALPNVAAGQVLGRQLLRSATSVGANYRSACRGRSKAEFIAKVGIAIEEADEANYWLEMITEARLLPPEKLSDLMQEGDEIVAILTASVQTARRNLRRTINNRQSASDNRLK